MFRRNFSVKKNTSLKSSAKKNFASKFLEAFPGLHETDAHNLWSGEAAIVKVITFSGRTVNLFVCDKVPVAFEYEDRLYPTIYFVWKYPNCVPWFTIEEVTYSRLRSGACLMLPGIILTSDSFDDYCQLQQHSACAVHVVGTFMPVAVGRTLMSANQMLENHMRGKGVEMLHFYHDCLWEYGPKSEVPRAPAFDVKVETNEGNSTVTPSLSDVAEEETAVVVDTNAAIRDYTLAALKKLRGEELPLLVSSFFGGKLLPSIPEDKKINIKHTKYKKFSTLLTELQDEGVVMVEKDKNVDFITQVDKSHSAFRGVSFEALSLKDITAKEPETKSKTVFAELFMLNEELRHLLKAVRVEVRKNSKMSKSDLQKYVTLYIRQKGLARRNCVVIDELIHHCLSGYRVSAKFSVDNEISWVELFEQLFQTLKPVHEIRFSDGHVESRSGHVPSLVISVATRTGNKKVTLINNLSSHCIDPAQFAKELQQKAAASTTLNTVPQSVGPQVQVQGDKITLVEKILMENFNVPRKFIRT